MVKVGNGNPLAFGDIRPRAKMRWGSYSRVSTESQEDSIGVQQDEIRNWVERSDGILASEYADIRSGTRWKKRLGYLGLKEVVRGRRVDGIVARDSSRFGRKPAELSALFDLCQQYNVEMWDMQMGRLTGLHIWILGIVAAMQVSSGSGQIHLALLNKTMKGLRAGGKIHGYRTVHKVSDSGQIEKGHVEKVDVEVENIEKIYNYADYDSLSEQAIARLLNVAGTPSPNGGKWSRKRVAYILRNPFYCAKLRWNLHRNEWDSETEALKKAPRDGADHVNIDGKHDPIIKREQWLRVQGKLERPVSPHAGRKPGPRTFLSGLLKCSECGGSLCVCGGDGRKLRVACGSHIEGKCENNRTFYRHHIHETILVGMIEALQTDGAVQMHLEEGNAASSAFLKTHAKDRAKLKAQFLRTEGEIDTLVDAVASGGDKGIFMPRIEQRKKSLDETNARLERLDEAAISFQAEPTSIRRYLDRIQTLLQQVRTEPGKLDPELSEKIEALIERAVVTPNVGRRGFSVEVWGRLAKLVTGQTSFKVEDRKNNVLSDIRESETITMHKAAEKLVFPLFKGLFDPAPGKQLPVRGPASRKKGRPIRRRLPSDLQQNAAPKRPSAPGSV